MLKAALHTSHHVLLCTAKANSSCCGYVVELTGAVALQDTGTWKEAQQGQGHFH